MSSPNIDGYALWLEPDEASRQFLQNHIADLASAEPSSPAFPPHITLLHPLPLHTTVDAIERGVRQALSDSAIHTLGLILQRAEGGTSYYRSVLSPVQSQADLETLRRSCERIFDVHPEASYFPHLSLQYGFITDARRQELANLVNESSPFPVQIRLTHIAVISIMGSVENWKKVGMVAIGDLHAQEGGNSCRGS